MNATVAYAHAIARGKLADFEREEAARMRAAGRTNERTGPTERRRLPKGTGRRVRDRKFLSQPEITEMVGRESRSCWSCGTELVGPDGHACNGSMADMEDGVGEEVHAAIADSSASPSRVSPAPAPDSSSCNTVRSSAGNARVV